MSEFPENDVDILPDYREYVPKNIQAVIAGLNESLGGHPVVLPETVNEDMPLSVLPGPENTRARQVELARKHVLRFLQYERKNLVPPQKYLEDEIFPQIHHREFQDALTKIAKIRSGSGHGPYPDALPRPWEIRAYSHDDTRPSTIDADVLTTAFERAPITYRDVTEVENPGPHGPPPTTQTITATLRGYAGPVLNVDQRVKLVELHEWLGGRAERVFRLGLLRAECYVGKSDVQSLTKAMQEYTELLPRIRTTPITIFGIPLNLFEEFIPPTMAANMTPRQKFVAIRAAFAYLALGDQLFRKQGALSDQDRQHITRANLAIITVTPVRK